MEGAAFWALAGIAAILVGLSKGGLPVVGILAVPVLSLAIPPMTAAGLLLPIYLLSDLFGLYAWRHDWDRRVLAIILPAAAVGIALGWATAQWVSERMVGGLVGALGASFALTLLLRRPDRQAARPARLLPGLFWGTITGFTSFVSHAGGPPFQVYVLPLGLDKLRFAGTATIAFAAINAMKLLPYWALGQMTVERLTAALFLAGPAVAAVFAGVRLVRALPPRLFFLAVSWALLAVSLELLRRAIF